MAKSDVLLRKVHETFPAEQVDDVLTLLHEQPDVRVQLAVLKLSEGSLDRLLVWLDEARKDWRDALAAAEYPRQASLRPGSASAQVIAQDRAEYMDWLG